MYPPTLNQLRSVTFANVTTHKRERKRISRLVYVTSPEPSLTLPPRKTMMWFGCVGASTKSASVWLVKHSDEACSLASGLGVRFVWVFATAINLPNKLKAKNSSLRTITCCRHLYPTIKS